MTAIEREIFLTGIGGQGVQLAAKVLALAATHEGRNVMSLGTYGGTMRGGNTDSTVVVAEERIVSPPVVSRGWSAVVVHPRYFAPLARKLRPDGVVVFDESLVDDASPLSTGAARSFGVDAASLAREAGAPRAGSLVLLGALAGLTGLVSLDGLRAGMQAALPPYRQQHLEENQRAIAIGYAALPAGSVPAWEVAA